jgi:hypothetical protein
VRQHVEKRAAEGDVGGGAGDARVEVVCGRAWRSVRMRVTTEEAWVTLGQGGARRGRRWRATAVEMMRQRGLKAVEMWFVVEKGRR